jgi:hypothetical protein
MAAYLGIDLKHGDLVIGTVGAQQQSCLPKPLHAVEIELGVDADQRCSFYE